MSATGCLEMASGKGEIRAAVSTCSNERACKSCSVQNPLGACKGATRITSGVSATGYARMALWKGQAVIAILTCSSARLCLMLPREPLEAYITLILTLRLGGTLACLRNMLRHIHNRECVRECVIGMPEQ